MTDLQEANARFGAKLTVCEVHGPAFDLSRRCPDCDRPLRSVMFIPCDEAAAERAETELVGAPFDWRTYSPAQVVDVVVRALAGQTPEEIADAYLRAAGETP